MSVFPEITLRLENYLKAGFLNKEIVSAFGKQEAERKFETLLQNLSHPPSFTTVRENTHLVSVQHVKNLLCDELQKQFNGLSFPVLQHPDLQDVLLIPIIGPRRSFLELGFKTLKKRLLPNCYSGFGAGDPGEMGLSAGGRGLYALHGEPPFLPESFDGILLDAPCSGMGQRPYMACTWTWKEVISYQPLQRKLFTVAVELLKPGGVLVYSTCTVTLAENEEQVAWALGTFPCLQLQRQETQIGGAGMMGVGLTSEQLKQLQRFDPLVVPSRDTDFDCLRDTRTEDIWLANEDCVGFFIAKFVKCKSTEKEP